MISYLSQILLVFLLLLGCQQSYKSTRQEQSAKNFQNINQLKIGMSLDQVRQIMNIKYDWETQHPNPEYYEHLYGIDSTKYLVHFYRYQQWVSGNLVYNDKRFFPVILQENVIVGLGWEGYRSILGDELKTAKGDSKVSSINSSSRNREHNPKQPRKENEMSLGTGFIVSADGILVTNYHVVDGATSLKVYLSKIDREFNGKVIIKDESNDLAILAIDDSTFRRSYIPTINYNIANTQDVKMGQEVFTLGFPLGTIMGSIPRLSVGVINSLYGIDEDPRVFQISNPLQPGNSGGPLFNYRGELVGVVVSSLNAAYFLYYSGIVPQNVNFAIKVNYLNTLLDLSGVNIEREGPMFNNKEVPLENLVKNLEDYIVVIKSYY